MQTEVLGLPANLLVGVRYEYTDVEATSVVFVSPGLVWQDNNDFSVLQGGPGTDQAFNETTDYDHVLPSLDFDIDLRDDLKARFGYSTTIARAQYNDLRAAVVPGGTQGSSINGFRPTANAGNSSLVPLESDNLDLSLEYYFGRSSYAAVGLFGKRVANFIGLQANPETVYGIRDQTSGPRAQAALAELQSRNFSTDDTNLFVMMAMMANPETGGAAAFNGTEAQHIDIARRYDLLSSPEDPFFQFNVTRPVNNREADIWGTELALQHFFGDSGFGVQANYTMVEGDVEFDDTGAVGVNQFALLGLSDSANLVGIYEKYGFTVRLAWNWREEYLQSVNVGCCTNPVYVEDYKQLDLSVGYQFNDNLSLSFEGINISEEDVRWHGRSDNMVWLVEEQGARYALGARYRF
jgi:TonB-dependent receptor